jgi:putative copper resistance protein D
MTVIDQARVVRAPRLDRATSLRGILGLVTACLLAIVAALALTADSTATGSAAGLSDAGGLTRRLLPLARGLFEIGAVGTVGALVAAGWLLGSPSDSTGPARRRLLRAATGWASAWCAVTLVYLLASVSQVVGVPLLRLLRTPDMLLYGIDLPEGRALVLIALTALAVALWSSALRTVVWTRIFAGVALASMGPLLATGHAATASNHFLSTQTLLVHVLAVTVWVGGLVALVVHLRRERALLPDAVQRFSKVALVCFVAVGLSGLVGAWTRLGTDLEVWTSTYGALLLVKTVLIAVLGGIGWWHRNRTITALRQGRPHAFLKLAGSEVLVMGAVMGLAVVLGRTAPPVDAVLRAAPVHSAPYPTIDAQIPPVSALKLLVVARPDALVLSLLLALATVTVLAARRITTGGEWSRGRRLAFGGGLLLLAWSLLGGLGAYSTALLSAQVAQFWVLALVAPALLVLGLPEGLRWPVAIDGAAPLLQRLHECARPMNLAIALVVLAAVTYQTPLLALSLHSVLGHLLLGLVTFALGLLLFGSARVGAGRQDERHAELRNGLRLVAALLAVYTWHMGTTATPYADGFFREIDWWWSDAATDQRIAAVVMGVFAVGLLVGTSVVRRRATVPEAAEAAADESVGAAHR